MNPRNKAYKITLDLLQHLIRKQGSTAAKLMWGFLQS